MRTGKIIFGLLFFCMLHEGIAQKHDNLKYKNKNLPVEERVDDLLGRMTLEEKIQQLNQQTLGRSNNENNTGEKIKGIPAEVGSLIYYDADPIRRNEVQRKAMNESRLKIPVLFGYDVIHGFRTIYPISLAQACSWNPRLVEQASGVAAQESRMSGVDWTFSPMIDVARDPRWGRVTEGYGEDTYTNSVFCVAAVKGYQGGDLSNPKSIAACLKHYVGYGASEGGRDYTYTEISRQTLWDTYLPPFQAGVEAGAATIMSAFNDISGVPASSNYYTLTDVLKKKWQFDGLVVSDWGSVRQLTNQGVAGSEKEAALKAFTAGVDLDMIDACYVNYLSELLDEGKITMAQIDDAVKRVLRLKFQLGLFENPYTPVYTDQQRFLLPQSRDIAEKLAEETIVLLKNQSKILPLTSQKSIALIGPLAKAKIHLLGACSWHGREEDIVSIYEGLEQEFRDKMAINYALGCDFEGDDRSGIAEAVQQAEKSDVIILCLGEKKEWTGENRAKSTLALPEIQESLLAELKKTGKPVVLLLNNGRPLELNRIEPLCDAIVELWQPGIAGGRPAAGVLSGRINPSGKLAMTFPYTSGQIPMYYNMRKRSRPKQGKYQDIQDEPLYQFAHGLSYTDFQYGEISASAAKVKSGDRLTLEIPVTNTGGKDGAETVHWFITDPACSISRPVKELKFFEKQLIKTGETKLFKFDVDLEKDFGYIDENGDYMLEAGKIYVTVKNKKTEIEVVTDTHL